MGDWQPIETAPRGKAILVFPSTRHNGREPTWAWESGVAVAFIPLDKPDDFSVDGEDWCFFSVDREDCLEPTHWMSLPAPPP